MDRSCVGSDLAAIEFCIAVHKIYHQRFMNPTWILTVDNIASEELALRDALMYFGDWRTAMMDGTLAPPGGGNVVQGKDRQRMCIASTTYKNLRFSVCGFITYAKKLLARGIDDIESGHSNTSALESRFSMAKRSGNNSTDTYHNVPSNQNIVMALKHAKKKDRKMVKGNTSYEPDSIATELSEPIGFARRVGDMMNSWKREAVIIASNASEMLLDQDDQYMLPLHLKKPVKSMLGVLLVAKLQSKAIPGKTIVNFLRNHQVVKDLMVLALSSSSIHQTWIHGLYGPSTKLWSEQLHFLLETAFQLLDASADSKKASHESSFWWQVANVMRNQSIHLMSPHPTCCSTHIRSYLFIFLAQQLLGWCKDLLDKHKEKQEEELVTADCWQRGKVMSIDFATIGHNVNSYFGYALHRVNREYRQYEEVGKGGDADEFELLTHMIAAGENIVSDQAYLNEYYDHYFNFLNQGGMTMVSPLYVKLFHTIFYEICLCLNKKKLFDEKDKKAMALARATVMNQLNGWVQEVQMIASSELQFEDPAKVCMKLLSKIITKVFNARTNTVLKRYQSTHLARGGCTSSKSSMREERKHEGKGRKKVHS